VLEESHNGTIRVYWNPAYSSRLLTPRGGFKLVKREFSIKVHQNIVSNMAWDANSRHHLNYNLIKDTLNLFYLGCRLQKVCLKHSFSVSILDFSRPINYISVVRLPSNRVVRIFCSGNYLKPTAPTLLL
jgi:hypothetical protein